MHLNFEYLRIQHGLDADYHNQFMYLVESEALITSARADYNTNLEIGMDVLNEAHTQILADEGVSNFKCV